MFLPHNRYILTDSAQRWSSNLSSWNRPGPTKVENGHDAKEDGTVLPVNQRRRALVAFRTAGRSCASGGSKLGCFRSVSAAQ